MHDTFWFFAAWSLAGLINNITGFGAAMVAIPLIANFIPLEIAVPASTPIVLTLNLQVAWKYRHHIRRAPLCHLLMGSLAGTVVGLWSYQAVNSEALKSGMGLFVAAYALYNLRAPQHSPCSLGPGWGIGAGFASTVLGAIFGFNGPPLALYVSKTGWGQEETKGLLGACFIVTGSIILAGQLLAGLHNSQTITGYLTGCPGTLLGGALGLSLSRRISQNMYQKAVLLLLFASGIYICFI